MKYYLIIALLIISFSAERRFKRNKHNLSGTLGDKGFKINYGYRNIKEFKIRSETEMHSTIGGLGKCFFKNDPKEENAFRREVMKNFNSNSKIEDFIGYVIDYAKKAAEEDPYYCVRGIEPKNTKLENFEVDENKRYDPEKVKYPAEFNNYDNSRLPIKEFSEKSDKPLKETIYLSNKGYKSIKDNLEPLENLIKNAINKEIEAKDNLAEAAEYMRNELYKHGYISLVGVRISRGDPDGCGYSAAGYDMTYRGLDIEICSSYLKLGD